MYTLSMQAHEAGINKLPNWLSFNSTSGTLSGVPLNEDKEKLYITLGVYISKGGGSVVVSETLFSVKVVGQKAPSSLTPSKAQPILLNESNCLENFYLSCEPVPSFPTCPSGSPPLLANLLTYPNMTKLSGATRASLVVFLSTAIGICPSSLVVDSVGWSSIERMKLWSQLSKTGITEYLDSTSAISLTLSCGIIDPISQPVVDFILLKLDQFLTKHPQTEFVALLWFLSSGAIVLEKSTDVRSRRQVVDPEELPTIEKRTTSPELVSSSSSVAEGSSAVDGGVIMLSTSSTTMTNMLTMHRAYSTATFLSLSDI